ncbi:MAG: hypothetical protein WA133_05420 [Syntrophales bacterium]
MKIVVIALVSAFFLTLSVTNLISAYQMKHPLEFVMVFFSQSLMLMISIVGLIYSFLQLYLFLKKDGLK